jgi:hypothetical protein
VFVTYNIRKSRSQYKHFMPHSAGQIAENSSGVQVHANEACKNEKHVCVSCKQKVFLRIGVKLTTNGVPRMKHFAHNATNVTKCSGYSGGETEEHLKAKKYVADNIEDFRFIDQSCDSCHTPNPMQCFRFNKDNWTVIIEGRIKGTALGKDRPRRADILLQAKSNTDLIRLKPWYSIEIQHSHAVSMDKTKALHMVGCAIIEVFASEVLNFKEEDKPFYISNVHSLCRIPWTCKACMEVVANERIARWLEYEKWYQYQWVHQKRLVIETMSNEERSSKRRCLQAQAFQSMESIETEMFHNSLPKCVGKCVACHKWIRHENYHFFDALDLLTESEQWWRNAIRRDNFLMGMSRVNKMIFCINCIRPCLNCETIQPVETLQRYGLCRLCNTDNEWFDFHIRGRWVGDSDSDYD